MPFLLDTDICIYFIKQRPPQVVQRLQMHADEGLAVSAVTAGELAYGVHRNGSQKNELALERFLHTVDVLPFDAEAAQHFGRIKAWLNSQGTPIGPLDYQIAAHALSIGYTLVSNNTREFSRVPGLRLANWAS